MRIQRTQPYPGNAGRIRATTGLVFPLALAALFTLLFDAKAANTATLIGNCQSVILNSVQVTAVGGIPGTSFFSTFDGRNDIPPFRQAVGGSFLYGGELRKRSVGVYEADYSTINNSSGAYIYYGSLVVTLPTLDSDGLGIPDFAQRDKLGTLSVTGTYYTRDWPTVATVAITGNLTRSAGSTLGSYSIVDQATGGNVASIGGTMEVQTYTGNFTYTRGAQNTGAVTMSRITAGTTFNLTANTPFTVTSVNQISLPQFQMTNSVDGLVYTVQATTFARTGNKYVGNLRFTDGDLRTSWADHTDWVFVVTDSNDTDANGIPDLSDSLPAAPTITTQPQNQTVTVGANVTFTVAASGTAPFAYQWKHAGTNLPSQNSTTLTLNSVTAVWAGAYTVAVSNVGGTTTSTTATLMVNPPVPVIASSAAATATVGSAFSYTITANNSPTGYGATGLPAGLNVNSATGVISGTPTTAGSFTVNLSASNAGGTGTRTLTLTINAAPAITTQPQSQTVAAGSSVTFSVVATGTAPFSYQWRKDGTNLAGATGSSYSIANAQTNHVGSYTVVVSNVAGSATSAPPAVLTVVLTPNITTQPQSQTVAIGASVSFTVVATGALPLSYQWRFFGTNLLGQVASTLTLTNVTSVQAGSYSVVASNSAGTVTSTSAALTVVSAFTVPTGVTSSFPAPTVPLLWWPGDGNASDFQGSRNGTMQGAVTFAAGKVNQAFEFDGVNAAVLRTADVPTSATDNWAMSAWVFWRGRTFTAGQKNQTIFYSGNGGLNGYGLIIIEQGDATNFPMLAPYLGKLVVLLGGVNWLATTNALDTNAWNHLVLTRENGVIKLYKDGEAIPVPGGFAPNTPSPASGGGFFVSGPPPSTFYGRIDDVCFFGSALTSNHVQGIYQAGAAGFARSPEFSQFTIRSDGMISLSLKGRTGKNLMLQSSSNLFTWDPVVTVTNWTGSNTLSYPVPTNSVRRFYRAIHP